jgi:hypothetical protein
MRMLMPDPINQILAISSTSDCLSIKMSAVNLLSCHRINQVYLCEPNGVLKRILNDTCSVSLYMRDFQGAMTLCEMEIIPKDEMVLQLQVNWYLVHLPQPSTCQINCLNSFVSKIFIKQGAIQIHVSPSCPLQLKPHVLISNFAIQLDAVIKHYKWELEQVFFSPEEQARSEEWLANNILPSGASSSAPWALSTSLPWLSLPDSSSSPATSGRYDNTSLTGSL